MSHVSKQRIEQCLADRWYSYIIARRRGPETRPAITHEENSGGLHLRLAYVPFEGFGNFSVLASFVHVLFSLLRGIKRSMPNGLSYYYIPITLALKVGI